MSLQYCVIFNSNDQAKLAKYSLPLSLPLLYLFPLLLPSPLLFLSAFPLPPSFAIKIGLPHTRLISHLARQRRALIYLVGPHWPWPKKVCYTMSCDEIARRIEMKWKCLPLPLPSPSPTRLFCASPRLRKGSSIVDNTTRMHAEAINQKAF